MSHEAMNSALAGVFNTNNAQERLQEAAAVEKQAAANLLAGIQSGAIDVDQLSEEDVMKVAHIVQQGIQHMPELRAVAEQQKTAAPNNDADALFKQAYAQSFNATMNDPTMLGRADAVGRISAHAHWNELQNINADAQEKQAQADLMNITGAQWAAAIESGQIKVAELSPEMAQYVLQKIAMFDEDNPMGAMGGVMGDSDTIPFRPGDPSNKIRVSKGKGAADIPVAGQYAGAGAALDQAPSTAHSQRQATAVSAMEAPKKPAGTAAAPAKAEAEAAEGLLSRLSGGIRSGAASVDDAARWLGGKAGLQGPVGQRLLGYGLPLAALGAGGAGIYSMMGDSGKEVTASINGPIPFTPLNEQEKVAAVQIGTAYHRGQLDLTKLSHADLDYVDRLFWRAVLEKEANVSADLEALGYTPGSGAGGMGAGPSIGLGAMGGVAEAGEAIPGTGILGSDIDPHIKGQGSVRSRTADAVRGAVGATKDAVTDQGKGVLDFLKRHGGAAADAIGGAARSTHHALGRLGSSIPGVAKGSTLGYALGYGLPTAGLLGAGGAAYGLSGGGEKQASAQPTQAEIDAAWQNEVLKTAEAYYTINGQNHGSSLFDPNAVHQAALQILQQNGWTVE